MATLDKDPLAFRTIGELSEDLGVAQHILRYWETKFPQLRPLQRAGNRRYYRPADVALVRRIHRLLSEEGYTVRGVQKLLRTRDSGESAASAETAETPAAPAPTIPVELPTAASGVPVEALRGIRDRLASALAD